jgi:pyruvate formate lyase activating enzyme
MDAFNIDLKAFTDKFYRDQTGAKLDPVLRTLKGIRKKGRHLEITFLVIPTLNDQEPAFMEMVEWIEGELGNETVLHLSAYHPEYKQNIASTPGTTLEKLCKIAAKKLKYVYAGNIPLGSFRDTFCHVCGELLIHRKGYSVIVSNLSETGRCMICNSHIIHRE